MSESSLKGVVGGGRNHKQKDETRIRILKNLIRANYKIKAEQHKHGHPFVVDTDFNPTPAPKRRRRRREAPRPDRPPETR